jgi:hypothetical protein
MNPINNYNQTTKKDIPCKYDCGNRIRFDPNILSDISRKVIPLNLDGTPHYCPNRSHQGKDTIRTCYYCKQNITFHDHIKTPTGKRIPLNLNDSIHDCERNPYNQARLGRKNNS